MFDPNKLDLDPNSKKPEEIEKPHPWIPSPLQEKEATKIQKVEKVEIKKIEEEKIIFDININFLQDILNIIIDKKYDFVVFEPNDKSVKITFKKDGVDADIRHIKYPTYSNIVIKVKQITKLKLEETEKTQEWKGEIGIKKNSYELISKTTSSWFWENLFLKTKQIAKKITKQKKAITASQIFWFLSAIAFIWLVLWWIFLSIILFNSNNVTDLKFFNGLWIDVNSVREFTAKVVDSIFWILVFIETLFLIIFLYKYSLTKKEFKQNKVKYAIFSSIFTIILIVSVAVWMSLSNKINSLNWENFWKIEFYDNSRLLAKDFDITWAKINIKDKLIWPITIKFNTEEFMKKIREDWFKGKEIKWILGDKEYLKSIEDYDFFHTFDKVGINKVKLEIIWDNINWEKETIKVDVWNIDLSYIVDIKERNLQSWWKEVSFNAESLSNEWKIEWYEFGEEWKKLITKSYDLYITKTNSKETIIWMYINKKWKISELMDKIFIIKENEKNELKWRIIKKVDLVNDLKYELKVDNLENSIWKWYITKFKWIIDDKEITKEWSIENNSESSKVDFTFKEYRKHKIKVILTNSAWEEKEIEEEIEIFKKIKLKSKLRIFNEKELINDLKYEEKTNEYFIDEIAIPTKLKLDARFVKTINSLYTLKKVNWDFNSDWDIDESKRLSYYEIVTEGNHIITVEYIFSHRRIKEKTISLKEKIFIEAIKKDAIINFNIKKDNSYAPVVVKLDASKSIVKDENIVKFIWDYWDGITEERDAIVPGHKYLKHWDYEIKLKVITESWKEYETSKKLILKPKPQSVKIKTSMKSAPINSWIDFSSNESDGQISSYLWIFWDWNTSTQANPTHSFNESWEYEVKLKVEFTNNNVLEDIIKIEIYEE
jgi:PKD repeat protein